MTWNPRRPAIGPFPDLVVLHVVDAPAGRPREAYHFTHLHQSPAGSQMHGRLPRGLDPSAATVGD